MRTFAAPDKLNGDALAAELAAALGVPTVRVLLDPAAGQLHVDGVDDADPAAVRRIVSAHVPPPPPADPVEEFRKAVEAATSLAALKAALLGSTGPGAQPRSR